MLRLISITILVLAVMTALSSGALAKSPYMRAELSGGDLAAPVLVAGLLHDGWMNSYAMSPPVSDPAHTYTLRVYDADPNGNIGALWGTRTYYPAHDGVNAALRYPDGHFGTINGAFATALGTYLPKLPAVVQPEDGGTSVAWWLIPSGAALGLAVLGGGLAGILRTRRRQAAPAR